MTGAFYSGLLFIALLLSYFIVGGLLLAWAAYKRNNPWLWSLTAVVVLGPLAHAAWVAFKPLLPARIVETPAEEAPVDKRLAPRWRCESIADPQIFAVPTQIDRLSIEDATTFDVPSRELAKGALTAGSPLTRVLALPRDPMTCPRESCAHEWRLGRYGRLEEIDPDFERVPSLRLRVTAVADALVLSLEDDRQRFGTMRVARDPDMTFGLHTCPALAVATRMLVSRTLPSAPVVDPPNG